MRMSRKALTAATVAAAVIATAAITRSLAQTAVRPATATRAAVCDIIEVFKNYKKVETLNGELQKRQAQLDAEKQQRVQAVNQLAEEVKLLAEGSAEYGKRVEELLQRRYELEGWEKTQDQLLLRWHYQQTRQMFEDILRVVDDVAKDRGFNLVLYKESAALQATNTQELIEEVAARRKVLYSADELDITQEVLSRVNLAHGVR